MTGLKVKWGFDLYKEEPDNFSCIWIIDTTDFTLNVYTQFDVLYNGKIKHHKIGEILKTINFTP
jgi:hypothetical protein